MMVFRVPLRAPTGVDENPLLLRLSVRKLFVKVSGRYTVRPVTPYSGTST